MRNNPRLAWRLRLNGVVVSESHVLRSQYDFTETLGCSRLRKRVELLGRYAARDYKWDFGAKAEKARYQSLQFGVSYKRNGVGETGFRLSAFRWEILHNSDESLDLKCAPCYPQLLRPRGTLPVKIYE